MMTALNAALACVCALVLVQAVAKMDKQTCHSIRVGVILLMGGLLAEPLSLWFVGWGFWADTFIYAGILSFAIGNRRGLPRMQW